MIAAIGLAPAFGHAQSLLERLVMPGDLIQGHARLEENCDNCHAPFEKRNQRQLCLDCHKPIARDIAAGQGFHGRDPAVTGQECKHCHTDHKGRGADILGLNPLAFDHGVTDFALSGRHARTDCNGCHAPGRRFREAPSACIDCHRADDRHGGSLGTACADCHSAAGWDAARRGFDHDKTRFALTGAHRQADCGTCHLGEVYKGTPADCADCHRTQDVHRGRFGARCATCHGTERWTGVRFDHDRKTDFPLTGAHRETKCKACHDTTAPSKTPRKLCIDCHRGDDVHDGRNGRVCSDCHNSKDWTDSSFDHGKTRFALRGAHASAPCETCHVRPAAEVALPRDCYGCHARRDVHKGRFGQGCADCHDETRWRAVRFDHGRTRFPLRAAHARLACAACHTRPAAEVKLGTACFDCHAKNDPHKGALGRDCARCHNETRWRQNVFFDHGLTSFPLIGLHAAVACADCHVSQVYSEAPGGCADCHAANDVHKGGLGRDCAACHNPNGWGLWLFDHATTGFTLTGGHEPLDCKDCHRRGAASGVTKRCSDCHRRDDVHRGGFGRRCERCHTTDTWRPVR